jgi:DNA-binding transcriptional ArsR family regulator
MISLHLTPADLAKVRFVPTIGPLAEAWESIAVLREPHPGPYWLAWRERMRRSLAASDELEINSFASRTGCLFDLLGVTGPTPTTVGTVAAFLDAPAERLEAEVDHLSRFGDPSLTRLGRLPASDAERRAFLRALHRYARGLIGDEWTKIERRLHADLRARTAGLATDGLGHVLRRLHGTVGWDQRTSTLTVDQRADGALNLGGRGVVVAPKYFTTRVAVHIPVEPDAPLILTYPLVRDAHGTEHPPSPRVADLAGVLGGTRATMLAAIARGQRTQRDLASAAGTTTVAISQHAAKLRAAGLITTVRRDGRARHYLTDVGEALVSSSLRAA